ncbi:MAG TPA: DUF1573 domain-containing protein [Cyclobacteriaceae bacterium]|nr:DUF1573 domain-containing protein [Cyclobacteriaceae bacterium]
MKKFSLLIVFFAIASLAFAQDNAKPSGPVIAWEKSSYDFGDIYQGDKVEHTYVFTNAGTEPLIITNVQVTCGCTTPKGWPKDPIPPGAKGEITIGFNSTGKMGKQNKVVTIVSNAVGTGNTVSFTTNVMDKKPAQ